jgi:hypothetical protein
MVYIPFENTVRSEPADLRAGLADCIPSAKSSRTEVAARKIAYVAG